MNEITLNINTDNVWDLVDNMEKNGFYLYLHKEKDKWVAFFDHIDMPHPVGYGETVSEAIRTAASKVFKTQNNKEDK